MSTTEIKFLKHPEGVIDVVEFRNSHGSAPVVWDLIAQKYLGLQPFHYSFHTEKLWPLWKDLTIPEHHRAVLAMTYDDTVIIKTDFKRAAEDIRKFLEDFPVNPEYVNHWPAILEIFEGIPDCDAIGFYWTSVSEDPFQGDWNEETEDYEPLNWKRYWSMYNTLDKFKEKE